MPELGERHALARCCWCGQAFVWGSVQKAKWDGAEQAWLCPTEACFRRQMKRARRWSAPGHEPLAYIPLPRQVEFLENTAKRVLFGGAAGGSKSHALRWFAYQRCSEVQGFRALVLRRTSPELKKTHLREAEIEAPRLGATALIGDQNKLVRFRNGSLLEFGHCETRQDAANYLSAEYDLIIFDELVTFEEEPYLLIASRARTRKAGVTPRVVAGTNPGGPQAHWVRARFIDHTTDRMQYPSYRGEDHAYIPSKLEDNPYLNQDYEEALLALPPELRKAYRDGDWDIFPGQYFPEFRKSTHVTAEHRVLPSELPRVLSMDWGFVKPGIVGWWVLHDGHLYREDEYVFTRTTAFEVGREIARRCKARGLKNIKYLVYDTAMEIPQNDTGEATIETVRRGIRAEKVAIGTRPADKDRINGWQRLRHWFRLSPDGSPWMQSSPNCGYFNRTIPSLVSDETKPEDVDTDGEDHAGDETRYLAMSMPMPGQAEKRTQTIAGTWGALKAMSREKAAGLLSKRGGRAA